jgi:hypothetical protein
MEAHGWQKGAYGVPNGPTCLLGSLAAVFGDDYATMEVATRVLETSMMIDLDTNYTITAANDQILKRKWEAVMLLRRAAKRARGQKVRPLAKQRQAAS